MRHTKLSPADFFKLSVAAAAFALGLAATAGLRPQPGARRYAEPAAAVLPSTRAVVTVRDTDAGRRDEARPAYVGRYDNYVYGFSVDLPAGMLGVGSAPPAPNHGFGIDLDAPGSAEWARRPGFPESYLYADGSYNSLEWRRLDEAVESRLSFLREEGANVRVQSRAWTRLGGLRALRVVARYERGGEPMVSDGIVAFDGGGGDAPSIVYTLDLTTPLSEYGRDRPALEALSKGWRLQPAR
ncbi:MAG TPA: hypothetical protein VF736_03135 [Pyrinomonadaceae bacterium]|jgi:hypothetical protein